MKARFVLSRIRGLRKGVSSLIPHLRRFERNDQAKERLRIISFYGSHGEAATKEAFGVDRKTIWVWQHKLKTFGGNLAALVPVSTSPKHIRQPVTQTRIIEEIKRLRENRPKLSKHKMKPALDRFCQKNGLMVISEATIGRVIKRKGYFFAKPNKAYHNPNSGWNKTRKRQRRIRVKHSPKPGRLGHIQMDTVLRIVDGTRWYFYQAIDVKGKAALSLAYKNATATNTVDFFKKLATFLPYPIRKVQTDNGSEFLGVFDQYLKQLKIKHLFIYPRCCRVNGVVERFNRIVQEEFIDYHEDELCHPKVFYSQLAEYMVFYNCERTHESLNDMTPIDYLIRKGGMSKMSRSGTPPE